MRIGTTEIAPVRGDLTAQEVDAIVNAANEYLKHGGGVAGAIVRAGGHSIQEESDAWVKANGPLGDGVAAVTSAGSLRARWVVHVAGPRYRPGQDNDGLLERAVAAALDAAQEAGARSVGLPAISAGIFGFPRREAAAVIAATVVRWAERHPEAMDEIRLVGYDAATVEAFAAGLAAI